MKRRPTIAQSLAASVQIDASQRGFIAFVPYWFAISLVLGSVVAILLPVSFFTDAGWDVSTAVYAGLLAFNGLLMSLGWFAFSRIQEIISGDSIGPMLARHDLLGHHLSFIDLSHLTLIMSCCLSGAGLVSIPFRLPILADQALFGATLGFTLYSMYRSYSATNMANDLLWEQSQQKMKKIPLSTIDGGNDKPQERS